MDRRKPILVNEYEQLTHSVLVESTAKFGMSVYPKVRIADVLSISNSGIPEDEYGYALKAHFDFVVAQSDSLPVMAIELDGKGHQVDQAVMRNDTLKNSLCSKLGLPLIRIDAPFLNEVAQKWSVLRWIIEVWFHYEAWSESQDQGIIPTDEPFLYFTAIGLDPFISARAQIERYYLKSLILDLAPKVSRIPERSGYVSSAAFIRVTESQTCIGKARCRVAIAPPIPSVNSRDLSEELAVLDALDRLNRYFGGLSKLATNEEADKVRDCYSQDEDQI